MDCPKCGAKRMVRDKPIHFNGANQEGDFLYLEEIYWCHICGKVIFVNKDLQTTSNKFVRGQVVLTEYEDL